MLWACVYVRVYEPNGSFQCLVPGPTTEYVLRFCRPPMFIVETRWQRREDHLHFLRTWKLDFVNFIHVQQRAENHLARKQRPVSLGIPQRKPANWKAVLISLVPRYGSLSGRNRKMRLAIGACSKYPPDRIQARCFCCFSWVIWGKGWVEKQIGNDFVLSY